MTELAQCCSISVTDLGLPAAAAIPAAKAALPKAAFVRGAVGTNVKQRLANDIAAIRFLGLLQERNLGYAGTKVPEILVLGLQLAPKAAGVPESVIELIASQRKSGIVFVVAREDADGGEASVALAVRRAMPSRPGHPPVYETFATDFAPASETMLLIPDAAATLDDVWDSFCSQIALGDDAFGDVDGRIARSRRAEQLKAQIAKLEADHKRAKNPQQRNEAFARLQQARKELAAL